MSQESEALVIPADEKPREVEWSERQIRVAAYCRVSTDDEEQATSFEGQKDYYTTKIMENRQWTMAGIFADEGLSGTSAKKRPEFQKMLRKCKQGKIDLILTKAVSRFARNTLDCIQITRQLRALGIAVYFEKENVNTMDMDSEFILTIMGSLAQAESESISRNVAWGKRQAMKSGKVMSFNRIYGYSQDEDDIPEIVPEEAEVVKRIFDWYLAGASVAQIIDRLAENNIPTPTNNERWTQSTLRTLIQNEKYCGDVLQQKTFVSDVLTKRIVKNNGQLPKYLIKNYHKPIISREIFYKVQAEYKLRTAQPVTEAQQSKIAYHRYSSKHALTNLVLCGECGTPYRRVVWKKRSGERQPVWRCINRLDNGKRYCKQSPTIQEYALQDGVLNTIKENFKPEDWLVIDNVPQKLAKRQWSHQDSHDIRELKNSLIALLGKDVVETEFSLLLEDGETEISRLQDASVHLSESLAVGGSVTDEEFAGANDLDWDETVIRNLVSKVIVQNENQVTIKFKNGKQAVLILGS